MLRIEGLEARIAGVQVLRDVHLEVPRGGTVALIGRNGAGKTTLLRTIMGFVRPVGGTIMLEDSRLDAVPAHDRPGFGIGYAPEDRRLFAAFTVEENIRLPAEVAGLPRAHWQERLDLVYEVAPELKELRTRGAGSLSGGQGKMVALGRALMIGTRLVLLDEPFQGLAPALANRYAEVLQKLHEEYPDITLLIAESNPTLLRNFAETTYTIERGAVAPSGDRRSATAAHLRPV